MGIISFPSGQPHSTIVTYLRKGGKTVGKAQLTQFGKDIKYRLVDMNKTQAWLMERVTEQTGLYMDSSYMYKILTGQLATPKVVAAIRSILELPEDAAVV